MPTSISMDDWDGRDFATQMLGKQPDPKNNKLFPRQQAVRLYKERDHRKPRNG